MLDDGALDGALPRAGVGDKTTMFCWTLAPVAYDIHTPVVTVAVHPAAEMPQADSVGCGCRISYGGERIPYPLNVVIDSSTPARCSALDVAPDSDLGTMYPFVPPAPPRGDRQPLCARERAR
jgi:hypothetical protein